MKFSLGSVDSGAKPASKSDYFARFHKNLKSEVLLAKNLFREEATGSWVDFQEVAGSGVRSLQEFLKEAGFMPRAEADGIFGYPTQASVRLFQEYLRSVKGISSIGTPDGVVGPNTLKHVQMWKDNNWGVCEWGQHSAQNSTDEFKQWIALLEKTKLHFMANPNDIVRAVSAYSKPSDTRKINEWDHSENTIHLIGFRRAQETLANRERRENDDLFVLLLNGMVFKFWGSTDPNPGIYGEKERAKRDRLPFLVEGQHVYQFGWHHVGDQTTVYRALRPASEGVLVFRDKNSDRVLTDADIVKGLDPEPNGTINIHWSGNGGLNYSAGCQVIAGSSYLNHNDQLVNCSAFAAVKAGQLNSSLTRGAYNVFTDLLLAYAKKGVRTISYTLGRDETLRLSDVWQEDFVRATVERMKSVR